MTAGIALVAKVPLFTDENSRTRGLPGAGWTFSSRRRASERRGRLRLTNRSPSGPLFIEAKHPGKLRQDMKTATAVSSSSARLAPRSLSGRTDVTSSDGDVDGE
jgi:hypothetical protein